MSTEGRGRKTVTPSSLEDAASKWGKCQSKKQQNGSKS
jgi:hypothetical protein